MKASVSFDRIADTYDQTRGGFPVGRTLRRRRSSNTSRRRAARSCELGVGTGLVALPLTERGYTVLGIDLSSKMIAVAQERIGSRVAIGDASRAPIASASCDAVVAARVLHVVGDPGAVLADAARMRPTRRPRGRDPRRLQPAGRTRPTSAKRRATMHSGRLRGPNADTVDRAGRRDRRRSELVEHGAHRARSSSTKRPASTRRRSGTVRGRASGRSTTRPGPRTAEPAIERLLALPDPDRPRRRQRCAAR